MCREKRIKQQQLEYTTKAQFQAILQVKRKTLELIEQELKKRLPHMLIKITQSLLQIFS